MQLPDKAEIDAFLSNMRVDFIDNSLDRMDELETIIVRLKSGQGERPEEFLDLQRHIHSLKGSAGSYGFQLVSQIAHRIEDYIETADHIGPAELDAIQGFLDRVRAILEAGDDPEPDEAAAILARLPSAAAAEAPVVRRHVNTLLVMPKGVQRKIIAQELAGWGMRLSMVENGVDSIQAAVCHPPGLIIASQELPDFSGVQLARLFGTMEATESCPFVLVTTYSEGNPALVGLPHDAAVVRKGKRFSADLRVLLESWKL
jgi:HPt (histidine-containing phosphotransfer) domain-containing protein/CheY-like chemotaxis protein